MLSERLLISTPIGEILLVSQSQKLSQIRLNAQLESFEPTTSLKPSSVLARAKVQLEAYFRGELKYFDLPLVWQGTPFQNRIWQQLAQLNYGETLTYAGLAESSGLKRQYARAIGMAMNRNPLPIVLPCHRIVGSAGQLTGYACGLDKKQWLLAHERKHHVKNAIFSEG